MPEYLQDIRHHLILRALEITHGNQRQASKLLGISPQVLSNSIAVGRQSK
ncbi:MAG: hypothetical protein EOL87_02085 [Spartobacteria bacterium]|nr:hypothetical protein [Spartobacteria bacterium]